MRRLTLFVSALICVSCAGRNAAAPRVDESAARDLETGKRVYGLHCGRCHGADGKDKTYPFIATLDGIGKRMSLEEILQATWATGFVSARQFTEDEKRGLAVFVASL